eukprot:9026687-Heterocapsa_arctica.AAC.1
MRRCCLRARGLTPSPPVCLWLPRTQARGAESRPWKLGTGSAIPGGIGLLVTVLSPPCLCL